MPINRNLDIVQLGDFEPSLSDILSEEIRKRVTRRFSQSLSDRPSLLPVDSADCQLSTVFRSSSLCRSSSHSLETRDLNLAFTSVPLQLSPFVLHFFWRLLTASGTAHSLSLSLSRLSTAPLTCFHNFRSFKANQSNMEQLMTSLEPSKDHFKSVSVQQMFIALSFLFLTNHI
jgi:hypothetical protein